MGRRRGPCPLPLVPRWRRLTVACKRRGSRGKKSTSTSEKSSTTADSIPRTDPSLANNGEILVLFETPSGFAIFCLKEDYLNQPHIWAIFGEHFRTEGIVWLKEFQTFKDKSSAIDNGTGVSRELTEMILRYHHPSQKLAVGKPEYKTIIETSLVNEQVVVAACLLLDAGLLEESHTEQLQWAAGKLKEVSGINSEGWDAMKIATALSIMFDPVEVTDDEMEIFTEEQLSTLEMTAHKYEDIIYKDLSLKIHSELVEMREVKKDALGALGFLLGSSV